MDVEKSEEDNSEDEGSLKDFIVDDESDDEFDDMAKKKSTLKENKVKAESVFIESSDEEDFEFITTEDLWISCLK